MQARLGERAQGTGAVVVGLVEARRSADVRNGAVPGIDEVADGERAARHLVDGDRAPGRPLGHPVDDERDAVSAESLDVAAGCVGRGEQDAPHALLSEEREVLGFLPAGALRAVADG
ncbi:hypothetical protein GCM10011578_087670 [Streptomyces fuscichromogenes]|uniref:Uncharacterized protein n=1 Tax=Streptomyces fuscichromogenes TaxID=1324013 RepID=A0A917XMP2_9ACTN|nr:hypothetical protein GCM10011578_087670 [Streptomyces fuscichromogenes]